MSALGMPGRLNKTGKRDPKMGSNRSQLSSRLIKHPPSKPHGASARNSVRDYKDFGYVREETSPYPLVPKHVEGLTHSSWGSGEGWEEGLRGHVHHSLAQSQSLWGRVSQAPGAGNPYKTGPLCRVPPLGIVLFEPRKTNQNLLFPSEITAFFH